jgi:hypothetical protein
MKGSTQMRDGLRVEKFRKYALSTIVLSLSISAISAVGIAQVSQPIASLQASNLAAGTKTKQSRNATLQELYGMFFIYAAHVETRAVADENLGNDRSFYRQHLQIASGLTTEEYAQVLASAQRFAAVDADVKAQVAESIEAGASSGQIDSLFEQRDSSLNTEIANVRQLLGQDQADIFEAYLQNEYIQQGSSPIPSQTQVSSSISPSPSSSTFTFPPSSLQASSQAAISAEVTADTVSIVGSQECVTDYTAEYDGDFTICANSQLSYLGSGQVEPYAAMYGTWTNIVLGYLEIQGYFYVNGSFNNGLGCSADYPQYTSCQHGPVTLASGNGALYQWYGKTTMGAYDVSCSVPDDCYETVDSAQSDTAEVQIYYPDINYISPNSVTPGDTGKTFTIDGEGLISPFQNTPTVSVTNQGSVFSNFSLQSFNYAAGTITIGYSVLSSANAGTQTVTVNNGFGTGAVNITINAPAPVITGITVSSSSASNVLQAGPATQTVTLTGSHLDTTWPTISIASGGAGVTLGSVVSASQTSVSFQVTVASDASAGTVTFQLDTDGKSCNAPALSIVAMVPPAITINFNGTNITDTADSSPTQVVVGQQIYLSISLADGADPSTIATSIDWAVPGTKIAGFTAFTNINTGQIIPLTQTEQPTILFYWIYPGAFAVNYTYCVDVDMQSCATATATFTVTGPTGVNMTATPGPSELFNENAVPTLSIGNIDATTGMAFIATMSAPGDQNTAFFVQLINQDDDKSQMSSGSPGVCNGPANAPALDHEFPYPPISTNLANVDGNLSTADSPSVLLDNEIESEEQRLFSATMYLMWYPTTPCNPSFECAMPAPLGSITWTYGQDAINTGQVQNVLNTGTTIQNDTPWILEACSQCTCPSMTFIPSVVSLPNYGYPTWTAPSTARTGAGSTEMQGAELSPRPVEPSTGNLRVMGSNK